MKYGQLVNAVAVVGKLQKEQLLQHGGHRVFNRLFRLFVVVRLLAYVVRAVDAARFLRALGLFAPHFFAVRALPFVVFRWAVVGHQFRKARKYRNLIRKKKVIRRRSAKFYSGRNGY